MGIVRYHIRRCPARKNHPMNTGVIREMLSKRIDGIVSLNQGVQRIDAILRFSRRMRGLSPELNIHRHTAQISSGSLMLGTGMGTKGKVHIFEVSLSYKGAFRGSLFSAFLSRCSINTDFSTDFLNHFFQSDCRKGRSCPEEIVSATVSQSFQRIKLRKKNGNRSFLLTLIGGNKTGSVSRCRHLNRKTVRRKRLGKLFRCKEFIIAHFRLRMNSERQILKAFSLFFYLPEDFLFFF